MTAEAYRCPASTTQRPQYDGILGTWSFDANGATTLTSLSAQVFMTRRNLVPAATSSMTVALLLAASAVFCAGDSGAAACQPEQGHITAAVAQTGQLGKIISSLAPIDELNRLSLFNCTG
jgi:hypothetical protein